MKRTRMIPERFQRIWAIAELITASPGASRRELARRFALSERQLQADLGVIRRDMGLPLKRAHGYRFDSGQADSRSMTLPDLYTLSLMFERAGRDAQIPKDDLGATATRLVDAFPPHLQPLARIALTGDPAGAFGPPPSLLASLTEAWIRRCTAKLRFQPGAGMGNPVEPIITPDVLFPYQGTWYLVGRCEQQQRLAIVSLDGLRTVTLEL